MNISETYSHIYGLEHLLVHKPYLWQEVQEMIASVDANTCRELRQGRYVYNSAGMDEAFKRLLAMNGWSGDRTSFWVTRNVKLAQKTVELPLGKQKQQIENAGEEPMSRYTRMNFIKDRVAIEVRFGKPAFVAYDLFVKHLAFYVGDKIDVGIEILPMKSLQKHMSSGVAYYEGELYNVIRHGRGVPAVPLVLVGIDVDDASN